MAFFSDLVEYSLQMKTDAWARLSDRTLKIIREERRQVVLDVKVGMDDGVK